MAENKVFLPEVIDLITDLRKGRESVANWLELKRLVENNTAQVCREADTRWLVSILDTYADFGDEVEKRNALLVVQIANFEKLWATNLLMYDVNENKEKLKELRRNKVIPLWDGMYSFNINHGDMTGNFFGRLESMLEGSPVILEIYRTIIERLKGSGMTLDHLDKYHRRLFEPYVKRSLFRILRKKILYFLKSYKI